MKMDITWGYLRELVKYGDKENKKDDEILGVSDNKELIDTQLKFEFKDAEDRDCCITMSNASLKRPVRLTKSMDLKTRLKND